MEQILSEIQIIKWLLIALVTIFGLIALGIVYIIYKTRNFAEKASISHSFSDEVKDLLEKGMTDEVIKRTQLRIESYPKDKYAHWYLALAYQDNKEYTKALEAFTALKKIAPTWNDKYIEPYVEDIKEILKTTKPELL